MKSYRLTAFRNPLELNSRPLPEPQGREVLLKVVAAGICHSDIHIWEGGYNIGNGKMYSVMDKGGIALPLTLGHEVAGVALRAGPESGPIALDRQYLVFPWIGCGQCATCAAGDEHLCNKSRSLGIYQDGGYADHMLVPDARYLLDLNGLDPVTTAPYACSGLTAFSALKKAGDVIYSEPIAVIGAGGLGLMCVQLLKAVGGKGAVVVDIDEDKRKAAVAAGAIAAVDGKAGDASSQIARAAGVRPRVVVDFVGSESSAALAFSAVAKGGKIVLVGLFGGAAPWSLPMIPLKAVTIQGSYVGNLAELAELLNLVRGKHVPPIPITRAPLEQADQMLGSLREGKVVGRVVLTPQ
ncbi:MAG TPA: alcohol dehydrogenase [Bryobacteraceae bacterium]|nr:alcohol dehydrogenase [Bryobacteraceae bacterium]